MSRPLYIADLVEDVLAQMSPKTRPTYQPAVLRLLAAHGDQRLDSVTLPDLERLRDDTRREIGHRRVTRALELGKRLRSYDPDAHGHGAAENAVRAMRFYFRYAKNRGFIQEDPSSALTPGPRPEPPERPLTTDELVDLWRGALDGSNDIELDSLLLTFVRHSAARREGCLNLCVDHLDLRRRTVTLSEKGGKVRELPIRLDILQRLEHHAMSRGADRAGDPVFRYRNGKPITRKRFNTIFDRADRNCGWTDALDVGIHWIRHTTLTDIASASSLRLSAAFAGHSDKELGVIGMYTKPSFEDLVDAYEAVFGARG